MALATVTNAVGTFRLETITSTGASFSWTKPLSGGDPYTYRIKARLSPSGTYSYLTPSFTQPATSGTITTLLTASTLYDFTMEASGDTGVETFGVITYSTLGSGVVAMIGDDRAGTFADC